MWFLFTFALVGFIVGLIARVLVSGPSPKGCLPTAILGMVGSFVGGFLGYVLFHHNPAKGAFQTSGFLGSLVGAIIVLLIYRRSAERKGR